MTTDSRSDIVNLAFSFQFRERLFQLADNVIRVLDTVGITKIASAVVILAVQNVFEHHFYKFRGRSLLADKFFDYYEFTLFIGMKQRANVKKRSDNSRSRRNSAAPYISG